MDSRQIVQGGVLCLGFGLVAALWVQTGPSIEIGIVKDKFNETRSSIPPTPRPQGTTKSREAARTIGQCDEMTAHPSDAGRRSAGVADTDVPVSKAIEICTEASLLDPSSGRLQFQLGRALWLAQRDFEAFDRFVEAADLGYAPALKFIGDAYLEGRGLPDGQIQDTPTALEWYKQSAGGGFSLADSAVEEVRQFLDTTSFDPSIFQNPVYSEMMYQGDFSNLMREPLFFSYAQGMFKFFNSEQAMDHAPDCKPELTKLGEISINFGLIGGWLIKTLDTVQGAQPPLGIVTDFFLRRPIAADQGEKDAARILLHFGGCMKSSVPAKMIENLISLDRAVEMQIDEFLPGGSELYREFKNAHQ